MARTKSIDATPEDFKAVIALLENGGTKKAACEMLGIAYNTGRLDTLIENFVARQELEKEHRAKKRREAVTPQEVGMWITSYLNGSGLADLSKEYFRSEAVIKYHLHKHGAMLRQQKTDRLNPAMLPEQCMATEFSPGQYVWSAAYNCVAQVICKYKNAYRIQVLSEGIQEFSYQPVYELGDMSHFEKLGVDLSKFVDYMKGDEVKQVLYETMTKANARHKKDAA
jgi:hypothetical protein